MYITSNFLLQGVGFPPDQPWSLPRISLTASDIQALTGGDDILRLSKFYVGGWEDFFDGATEIAWQHRYLMSGEFYLYSGTLLVDETFDFLHATPPDCEYIRVGYRGASGLIAQLGGTIDLCTDNNQSNPGTMTLGWWGASSRGDYILAGSGNFIGWGVDIGGQGFGRFQLLGGTLEGGTPISGSVTTIGRGYSHPTTSYLPATGMADIQRGDFHPTTLFIGDNYGSSGVLHVTGYADAEGNEVTSVNVATEIVVGRRGHGHITQLGGNVEARWFTLGELAGSTGQLTIAGGSLKATGTSFNQTFINGGRNDLNGNKIIEESEKRVLGGSGNIIIIGADASIELLGDYYQNQSSKISAVLGTSSPHVSKISLAGAGTFRTGAIIDVRVQTADNGTPLFSPTPGQSFTIIESTTGLEGEGEVENSSSLETHPLVDADLTLTADQPNDWVLSVENGSTVVVAKYCPGGACP